MKSGFSFKDYNIFDFIPIIFFILIVILSYKLYNNKQNFSNENYYIENDKNDIDSLKNMTMFNGYYCLTKEQEKLDVMLFYRDSINSYIVYDKSVDYFFTNKAYYLSHKLNNKTFDKIFYKNNYYYTLNNDNFTILRKFNINTDSLKNEGSFDIIPYIFLTF